MSGYEGFASIIEQLDGVTGINLQAAQVLVAECGIDMERFASDKHFATLLGVCPTNEVSAGKRLRARSGKGNRYARAILVQAAQGSPGAKAPICVRSMSATKDAWDTSKPSWRSLIVWRLSFTT